ncbi:MAG: hypothetical protein ACKPKO_33695, partial [Candidatus Fonsibacter sp.]
QLLVRRKVKAETSFEYSSSGQSAEVGELGGSDTGILVVVACSVFMKDLYGPRYSHAWTSFEKRITY